MLHFLRYRLAVGPRIKPYASPIIMILQKIERKETWSKISSVQIQKKSMVKNLLKNCLKIFWGKSNWKKDVLHEKTMYVCMSPFCPPPPLTTYVCTRGGRPFWTFPYLVSFTWRWNWSHMYDSLSPTISESFSRLSRSWLQCEWLTCVDMYRVQYMIQGSREYGYFVRKFILQ